VYNCDVVLCQSAVQSSSSQFHKHTSTVRCCVYVVCWATRRQVIQPVCRLITRNRNVGSVGSGVQSVQTSSVQLQAGHVRRQAGQCIKQTTWHVERGSLRTLSETADDTVSSARAPCHANVIDAAYVEHQSRGTTTRSRQRQQ